MGGVRAGFAAVVAGVVLAQLLPGPPGGPAPSVGTVVAADGEDGGRAVAAAGRDGAMPACAAAVAAAALAAALAWRRAGASGGATRVATALGVMAAGAAGAAVSRARLEAVCAGAVPDTHVARLHLPRHVTLVGRALGVPSRKPDGTVVVLEALRVDGDPATGLVRLAVRGSLPKLRAGDEVTLDTTLRRPRSFADPGSFDFAGQLARRGVLVTASAWDPQRLRRRSRPARTLAVAVQRWRQRLVRSIVRAAPGPAGPVLAALVVGEQGGIPPAVRDAFARAGVVHVLSVSGLHVSVVAAAAYLVVVRLLARSARLLQALDVRAVAAAASLVPVAGYAVLAGLEVPTLRSALMAAVSALALCLGRRADVLRTLGVAAVALALVWPGTPREIAFQLSFASVVAIVLGVRRFAPGEARSWRARARLAAVVSCAAAMGTAPLAARHFQQLSLVAPVANPLVVPLFGAGVVVLGLGAATVEPLAPGVAAAGFRLAAAVLRPGVAVVQGLATPSWAAVRVPRPDQLEMALCWMALAALLAPGGRARALAAAVAVLGLTLDAAWWLHDRAAPDRLRVTFLDVGQGDAAVAELPGGGVLVVDGGGFPGSAFDTGQAVVAPFLATRKILSVDALAMTHAHPDHYAGLASLLPRAGEVWWTGHAGSGPGWAAFAGAMATTRQRVLAIGSPMPRFARGVEVLHPPPGWEAHSPNDASLVLTLSQGDVRILLTGDVEAPAEAALLATPRPLRATVLKAPHHGSRTSSAPAFVDAVAPAVAVISVGADNRYGLPAPEVERRYRARGICVLRTDRCGAVTVETDGAALDVDSTLGCRCPAAGGVRPPS